MTGVSQQIMEIAARIKDMREISGFTVAEMAEKTEISQEQYLELLRAKLKPVYEKIWKNR